MANLTQRSLRPACLRYLIVSVGALSVDMAVFLVTLKLGLTAAVAATVAYLAGLVAHWTGSSRFVFADRTASPGPGRTRQQALFAGSALVGLGLTIVIVWACGRSGFDPRLAKLVAVVVSFQATWLLRNLFVFRPAHGIA